MVGLTWTRVTFEDGLKPIRYPSSRQRFSNLASLLCRYFVMVRQPEGGVTVAHRAKSLAERRAYEMSREKAWQLCTICPTLIQGPSLGTVPSPYVSCNVTAQLEERVLLISSPPPQARKGTTPRRK